METVERSARTVEEAVELALMELNVDRTEVEVETINRGKAGFLGIGGELARVRVTLKSEGSKPRSKPNNRGKSPRQTRPPRAPRTSKPRASEKPKSSEKPVTTEQTTEIVNTEEISALAITTVNDILTATNVDVVCNISSHHNLAEGTVALELSGSDTGLLIGRRGQTLMSLQFLVNSIVRSKTGENIRIAIDAEGYRDRRENTLKEMAVRVADRVKETGRSITLEPMNAADRRIIHVSLTDYEGVRTESIGEADNRKVEIYPED